MDYMRHFMIYWYIHQIVYCFILSQFSAYNLASALHDCALGFSCYVRDKPWATRCT